MVLIEKTYFTYWLYKPNIHMVKIHSVEPSTEIFEEYIEFSKFSINEMKGAMILDISKGRFLTTEQRIKLSKVIKANSTTIVKNWVSVAYVNTSIIAGLILKGILMLSPLPVKSKVFSSIEEALNWSYENYMQKA